MAHSVPENYRILPQASVALDFLKSNSSTHSYLFGAIAELVDNSRDAGATQMKIFCTEPSKQQGSLRNVRGKVINFLDNGCGMDQHEVISVMTFGHSQKRGKIEMSGQYGNGLKSGGFRLGTDMMIFSKQNDTCTAAMISKTFLEKENVTDVIVFPAPSWTRKSDGYYKPNINMDDPSDNTKYDTEMDLIKTYSPFDTFNDVTDVFDKISKQNETGNANGTAIVIYNLQKDAHGRLELRFEDADIKIEREVVGNELASRGTEQIELIFGLNIENRHQCGAVVYNNGRLIRMFEKPRSGNTALFILLTVKENRRKSLGIVCLVDLPFALMEPKSDKQGFVSENEYGILLKEVDKVTEIYRDEKGLKSDQDNLKFCCGMEEKKLNVEICEKTPRKIQMAQKADEKRKTLAAEKAAMQQRQQQIANQRRAALEKAKQQAARENLRVKSGIKHSQKTPQRQTTVRLSQPEDTDGEPSDQSNESVEEQEDTDEEEEEIGVGARKARAVGRLPSRVADRVSKVTPPKRARREPSPQPAPTARLTARQAMVQSRQAPQPTNNSASPPKKRGARVQSSSDEGAESAAEESGKSGPSDDETARKKAELMQERARKAEFAERKKREQEERKRKDRLMSGGDDAIAVDGQLSPSAQPMSPTPSSAAGGATPRVKNPSEGQMSKDKDRGDKQAVRLDLPTPSPDAMPDLHPSSGDVKTVSIATSSAKEQASGSSRGGGAADSNCPVCKQKDLFDTYKSIACQMYAFCSSDNPDQRTLTDKVARQLEPNMEQFFQNVTSKFQETLQNKVQPIFDEFNKFLRATGRPDEIQSLDQFQVLLEQWRADPRMRV